MCAAESLQPMYYFINFDEWGINPNCEDAEATTQGFNDAIQHAAKNGYYGVYIPGGRFLIDPVSKFGSLPEYGGGVRGASNLKIKMSKTARFYAMPNSATGYSIFYFELLENVELEGGFFMGDRDDHDYVYVKGKETHEWGYCIHIRGCKNVTIEKATCTHATGDNIWVAAKGMMNWNSDYTPSSSITIRKCVLERARRNNFATNGCEGLVFEDNDVNYAGGDTIGPQLGIDLEGFGEGGLKYDHPYKIIIKKNRFRENGRGAIRAFTAGEVIIDSNFADNDISYGYGTDVSIINNKIIRQPGQSSWANGIDSIGVSSTETGNRANISGNTVIGFENGITARGKGVKVNNNTIEGCTSQGIYVYQCEDALVTNNRIDSDCVHIRVHLSTDVKISGNKTKGSTQYYAIILDNAIDTVVHNNKLKGFGGIQCGITTDAALYKNTIDLTGTGRGIMWKAHSEVDVIGNTIKNARTYAIDGTADSRYINAVEDNRIKNCIGRTAILLTGGRKHSVINNKIRFKRNENGGYGVLLQNTDGVTVIRNDIDSVNEFTVTPVSSSAATNTTIAHNTIRGEIWKSQTDDVRDNINLTV